jgi:flavodoxin
MKILITFFSATGKTKKVAEIISKELNSDLYEIIPEKEYTSEDLNGYNEKSRTYIEHNTKDSRPKIKDKNANIEKYDIILIGFPIWWHIAPPIINTFLEMYNFKGKKIILFGTSMSEDFGQTILYLKDSCKGSEIIEGKVFKKINEIEIKKFAASIK